MNTEPLNTIRPTWTTIRPTERGARISASRMASDVVESGHVPQINKGWLKAKPAESAEFESDEALIFRKRVENVAIEIFIATSVPTMIVERPMIVLGAHKIEDFQLLINQTQTPEQTRQLIKLLNQTNANGKPLTASQFATRVKIVLQVQAELKLATAPAAFVKEKEMPYFMPTSMKVFVRKFELQVSALKLKLQKSLGMNDRKLRKELDLSADQTDYKKQMAKSEAKKAEIRKELQKERSSWDETLQSIGITSVLPPSGKVLGAASRVIIAQ